MKKEKFFMTLVLVLSLTVCSIGQIASAADSNLIYFSRYTSATTSDWTSNTTMAWANGSVSGHSTGLYVPYSRNTTTNYAYLNDVTLPENYVINVSLRSQSGSETGYGSFWFNYDIAAKTGYSVRLYGKRSTTDNIYGTKIKIGLCKNDEECQVSEYLPVDVALSNVVSAALKIIKNGNNIKVIDTYTDTLIIDYTDSETLLGGTVALTADKTSFGLYDMRISREDKYGTFVVDNDNFVDATASRKGTTTRPSESANYFKPADGSLVVCNDIMTGNYDLAVDAYVAGNLFAYNFGMQRMADVANRYVVAIRKGEAYLLKTNNAYPEKVLTTAKLAYKSDSNIVTGKDYILTIKYREGGKITVSMYRKDTETTIDLFSYTDTTNPYDGGFFGIAGTNGYVNCKMYSTTYTKYASCVEEGNVTFDDNTNTISVTGKVYDNMHTSEKPSVYAAIYSGDGNKLEAVKPADLTIFNVSEDGNYDNLLKYNATVSFDNLSDVYSGILNVKLFTWDNLSDCTPYAPVVELAK